MSTKFIGDGGSSTHPSLPWRIPYTRGNEDLMRSVTGSLFQRTKLKSILIQHYMETKNLSRQEAEKFTNMALSNDTFRNDITLKLLINDD